jgi:hypothetical protein
LRPRVVDDGPPEMSEVSVDAEGEAPCITTTPVTPTTGSTEETSSRTRTRTACVLRVSTNEQSKSNASDRYEYPSISSLSTQDSRLVRTWKELIIM